MHNIFPGALALFAVLLVVLGYVLFRAPSRGRRSFTEPVARLLTRWRAGGVKPNPPSTEAALSAFESANRVRLPDDLRALLRAADGIPFSELDGLSRLRPLAEFFQVVDRFPAARGHAAGPADPERYYCFGDYNIEGSFWAVRLSDDPAAAAPVRVVRDDGGGYEVAESVGEFLTRYVSEGPDGMC